MKEENTVNAILFELQLIYSTVTISKQLLLSYGMRYRSAVLQNIVDPKVGESQI